MSQYQLITETIESIDFHQDGKRLFVQGIYSEADKKNANGRRYTRELLNREVGKFQERIQNKTAYGALNHPPTPETPLEKVAILTTELEMMGNKVLGKSLVLDTPAGHIVRSIVKDGSLGISSRGLGTVGDNGYVNEDYQLITFDIVEQPSLQTAFVNGILEGVEYSPCQVKAILEAKDEDTLEISPSWSEYVFFYQMGAYKDYLQEQKCLCECCGQVQIATGGITCEQLHCATCMRPTLKPTDLSGEDIWNRRVEMWLNKIKEKTDGY
jgi:hypothetical protein